MHKLRDRVCISHIRYNLAAHVQACDSHSAGRKARERGIGKGRREGERTEEEAQVQVDRKADKLMRFQLKQGACHEATVDFARD